MLGNEKSKENTEFRDQLTNNEVDQNNLGVALRAGHNFIDSSNKVCLD